MHSLISKPRDREVRLGSAKPFTAVRIRPWRHRFIFFKSAN